ncbi:hypothetical protein L0P88_17485 [Muricauda sp. SCSIO 64092]|uniref:BfmA/BtgA family mobilization protein n=1 Tax=Allomuricauda sp. SCSIO 64092 TaxID=2908842 RepID=UPI001FF0E8B2|nr:BfmA/BtgA family mobilization protein [Muricauda sp. SCSIO 64092]UOY05729.1 hypothetical protein L0P88_17485 [Muricauda sp. SCSIO 64092]
MNTFSTVRFKIKVANRFRKFSMQVARTHTEALESMLDFFEIHQLSPSDSIDGSLSALEIRIKRRISNAIAIIKDIEKSQTLPTVAMLQSLFQEQFEPKEDSDLEDDFDFVEKKFENGHEQEEWLEETTVPKILYDRLEDKMEMLKKDFAYVLEHVKAVKSNFGKDYLKLELPMGAVEKYKRTIKNN